jgi:hypothetical protein
MRSAEGRTVTKTVTIRNVVARKLNRRQRDFVHHYTAGAAGVRGNATQAAIAAGYSRKSAYSIGHDLLKHPEVGGEVQRVEGERRAAASAAAEVDLEEWSREAEAAKRFIEGLASGRIPAPMNPAEVGFLSLRLKAATYAIDRVLGRPNQPNTLAIEHKNPVAEVLKREYTPAELQSLIDWLRARVREHPAAEQPREVLALPPGRELPTATDDRGRPAPECSGGSV